MKKVRFNLSRVVAIATCLAVTTMFSGCDDKNDEPTNITVGNRDALTQTVYADEKPLAVSFETKGAWTSSISEGTSKSTVSWISITPDSGNEAGEYTITIVLAPNDTGKDRSAVITISCDGTNISVNVTQKATNKDGTPYDPNVTSKGDVYVAGWELIDIASYRYVAKLWTNGVAQDLSDGIASSVYVVGSDVYVSGNGKNGSNNVAKVWKNGVAQDLTDGTKSASASFVYVAGNDVYVAGYELTPVPVGAAPSTVKVWKNGVAQDLTDGTKSASASSIYVSGNDVYVVGHESYVAKVWKNGVAQDLSDEYYYSQAFSVYVSGSDVYVAGYEDRASSYYAKLWKNGVAQELTDGTKRAQARSVCISGSDVYVAGYEGLVAKVWKNGVAQDLSDGNLTAGAHSVYVAGGDVYVAGYEGLVAKVWKNGVAQNLSDGTNEMMALSVFVVE